MEIIGIATAMDTVGVAYICAQPAYQCNAGVCVPYTGPCGTTSVFGDAHEVSALPGQCYLPVLTDDPYYDFMWDQPITLFGVDVRTPLKTAALSKAELPYAHRAQLAAIACPEMFSEIGWCVLENVCTEVDEAAELCTMDPPP